jgi:hypothetical protein
MMNVKPSARNSCCFGLPDLQDEGTELPRKKLGKLVQSYGPVSDVLVHCVSKFENFRARLNFTLNFDLSNVIDALLCLLFLNSRHNSASNFLI